MNDYNDDHYAMFEKMNTILLKDETICKVDEKLPKYMEVIIEEIKQAEEGYAVGDKALIENHIRRALGYFKKAKRLLGEEHGTKLKGTTRVASE